MKILKIMNSNPKKKLLLFLKSRLERYRREVEKSRNKRNKRRFLRKTLLKLKTINNNFKNLNSAKG
jgi:hypothetical protein